MKCLYPSACDSGIVNATNKVRDSVEYQQLILMINAITDLGPRKFCYQGPPYVGYQI